MNNRISFADFFKLAPGLIALDRELDAEGSPVSYRKYLAVEWLARKDCYDNTIKDLNAAVSKLGLDIYTFCPIRIDTVPSFIQKVAVDWLNV